MPPCMVYRSQSQNDHLQKLSLRKRLLAVCERPKIPVLKMARIKISYSHFYDILEPLFKHSFYSLLFEE